MFQILNTFASTKILVEIASNRFSHSLMCCGAMALDLCQNSGIIEYLENEIISFNQILSDCACIVYDRI